MCSETIKKRSRPIVRRLAVAIFIACLTACSFVPTAGAQPASQPKLTAEEAREAQELSMAFTKRLGETLDWGIVMNEMFLPDSIQRYLATEKRKAADSKASDMFFSPGISVGVGLLEKPVFEEWRRFYIATNNFMLLGFVYALSRQVNFEEIKPTDLYPREVIELLDHNPMLSNLIIKKSSNRNFKSAEEMRSATLTLDQAATLMRKVLPRNLDLEKAVVQMAMSQSSAKRPVKEEDLAKARAELIKPQLEVADDEYFGFPKGTRIIFVPTLSLHQLVLARVDGRLRIVWVDQNLGD